MTLRSPRNLIAAGLVLLAAAAALELFAKAALPDFFRGLKR